MPAATATQAPNLSALSKSISSHPSSATPALNRFHPLALQVQHNLQYQHDWTNLHIHTHSPLTQQQLPRPLISGRPPKRIYVHPDDQVEELKRGVKEDEAPVETEWVLPTHLREKWSLRRFGEVFDGIGEEPPESELEEEEGEDEKGEGDRGQVRRGRLGRPDRKRTGGKRVLLATLGDDSTVSTLR